MNKKIIYNISSLFGRKEALLQVIESIFNQCDTINVALNNYEYIPKELYDKKIRIFRTDNSKGDAFKFLELINSDGYFFTIDDDLIYPPDYTKYMIEKFHEYSKKSIITLHGRTFKQKPITSYYHSPCDYYPCLRDVPSDVKVEVGGTGVMCFHTDLFKIDINYFKYPNMADIWIAKYAKLNNIDIMCVKHTNFFLKYIQVQDTIYDNYHKNDELQTQIINSIFKY
ncbi:MAG TPA: hypothetical protein PK122_00190 [Candidatus Paceibacterota bacterium]|nr:hypothetical protein [Candidatus Paceibacterota bacterium]